MPLGPVNNDGTVLYYEDSGVPDGSTAYITVVLVHGTMFHSAVFRGMIPHASAANLRLVLLNLRDYPGSTRYSPDELRALGSPQREVQAAALQTRGFEIAAFIGWFIETEHIPPISVQPGPDGKTTGGFALLGWSSGNCQTMPLLAHSDKLSKETKMLFNAYFRSFILFGIYLLTAVGEPPLPGLYGPFRDTSLSPAEKTSVFSIWVSSYFTQIEMGLDDVDADSPDFAAMLIARTAVHEGKDGVDTCWMPTVQRMGPEALVEVCDNEVMARSQVLIQCLNPGVYQENVHRALFDCPVEDTSGEKQVIWPTVKVHIVWCDMTAGDIVFAVKKIMGMARNSDERCGKGRNVEFHRLAKANHFVHWDDPARVTQFLAGIV